MENTNYKYVFNAAMTVILIFLGFFLPENNILSPYGMKILFIFIGMLYGWSFWNLLGPSFLGMIALAFSGFGKITAIASLGFGDSTLIMIILFSIFTAWLTEIGFTDNIMSWFMSRKIFIGKPWIFIAAFLALSAAMGFLIGQFPAIFLMWTCVYQICEAAGYEKRSRFAGFLIFGVSMMTSAGNAIKPFSGWALSGLNMYASASGSEMAYPQYIAYTLIIFTAILLVFVLFAKLLFKINVLPLQQLDYTKIAKKHTWSKVQKIGAAMLIFTIFSLLLPDFLPACTIKTTLKTIGVIGTVMLMLTIMLFLRIDGKPVANFKALAAKGVDWNVTILLASTIAVGAALKSEEAGIMLFLQEVAISYLSDVPALMFYIAIVVVLGVLTQFCHNLVLLTSIGPMLVSVAISLGLSGEIVAMLCIVVLQCALATPGASTRAGQLFGNDEWVKVSDCYIFGWSSLVCTWIVLIIVGIPLGMLIF